MHLVSNLRDKPIMEHSVNTSGLKKAELRARVEEKLKQLESDVARYKADGYAATHEARKRAETKLAEVKEQLKGGWEQLSEKGAAKLNQLLD